MILTTVSVTPISLALTAQSTLQLVLRNTGERWGATEAPSPPLLMSSCHLPSRQDKPALQLPRPWPIAEMRTIIYSELTPSLRTQ